MFNPNWLFMRRIAVQLMLQPECNGGGSGRCRLVRFDELEALFFELLCIGAVADTVGFVICVTY